MIVIARRWPMLRAMVFAKKRGYGVCQRNGKPHIKVFVRRCPRAR